jgi:hypothetical protein
LTHFLGGSNIKFYGCSGKSWIGWAAWIAVAGTSMGKTRSKGAEFINWKRCVTIKRPPHQRMGRVFEPICPSLDRFDTLSCTENRAKQVEWWLCLLWSWQDSLFNVRKWFEVKTIENEGSKHEEKHLATPVEFEKFSLPKSCI